jgi:DHA1 family tetracycline resistance protein-like MFS transporter
MFIIFALASAKMINIKKTKHRSAEGRNVDRVNPGDKGVMNTPTTATAEEPADTLDFKKLLPILTVVLVDLLGLTIIIPLLPLYAASLRASPFMIGVLGAAYPLMQLIAAPILGRLSDRYGRKPVLVLSQIGTLVGFLMLGFANTLGLLFASRIIDGISGGNIATAQAMVTDSTSERTRTQGLGLIGAAFGLGFIIGPIIAFAALALSGNNYHVPAFLAAAISALSILLSWFWLHETHKPAQQSTMPARASMSPGRLFAALTTPRIGILLVLMFVQQFAFGGFEQFLPLLTLSRLGLNGSGNAAIFVFVGVLVVAVQGWLIGIWSRKWGERRLVLAGLALLALGLGLTALTPAQPVPWYNRSTIQQQLHATDTPAATTGGSNTTVPLPDDTHTGWLGIGWLLVAMIPASIGAGMVSPSINSLLTKRVASQQHGEVLGTSAAFTSGANVIAPLVGGAVFQLVGVAAPFWLWTVVLIGVFVLAWQNVAATAPIASVSLKETTSR